MFHNFKVQLFLFNTQTRTFFMFCSFYNDNTDIQDESLPSLGFQYTLEKSSLYEKPCSRATVTKFVSPASTSISKFLKVLSITCVLCTTVFTAGSLSSITWPTNTVTASYRGKLLSGVTRRPTNTVTASYRGKILPGVTRRPTNTVTASYRGKITKRRSTYVRTQSQRVQRLHMPTKSSTPPTLQDPCSLISEVNWFVLCLMPTITQLQLLTIKYK